MSVLKHLLALVPVALVSFAGCAVAVPDEAAPDEEEGESTAALTSCNTAAPGICVNYPINAAVECARRHGARVLSYYRGEAQQRCVRQLAHCTDPCVGMAGCSPIAANCGTSNHSRCLSVDFIDDGAPATHAQLAACGFGNFAGQRPHANHYDYVGAGGGATPPAPSSSGGKSSSGGSATPAPSGKGGTSGGSGATCASATLGTNVADGTCVQRAEDDAWYVCDGSNPTAWPPVSGATDSRCTSCPQLPGSVCDDAAGASSGGKGGGGK